MAEIEFMLLDKWCENQEELKKMAMKFFMDHFSYHQFISLDLKFEALGVPKLSKEHIDLLNHPFIRTELHDLIFQLQPDKTLGSDGFVIRFYKHFWEIVGTHVTRLILCFMDRGFFY